MTNQIRPNETADDDEVEARSCGPKLQPVAATNRAEPVALGRTRLSASSSAARPLSG